MEQRHIEEMAKQKITIMKARKPKENQWPFRYRTANELQEHNLPPRSSATSPLLNYPRTPAKREREKLESRQKVKQILESSLSGRTSTVEEARPISHQAIHRGAQVANFAKTTYDHVDDGSIIPAVARTDDFSFTLDLNKKSEDQTDYSESFQQREREYTGVGLRGDRKAKISQAHQHRLRSLQLQAYNYTDYKHTIDNASLKSSQLELARGSSTSFNQGRVSPGSVESVNSANFNAFSFPNKDATELGPSSPSPLQSAQSRRESPESLGVSPRSKSRNKGGIAKAPEKGVFRIGLGPQPPVGNQFAFKSYRLASLAPEMTIPTEFDNSPYYPQVLLSRWFESIPVFHNPVFTAEVRLRKKIDGNTKAPSVTADSQLIMHSRAIQRLLWGAAPLPEEYPGTIPVTPCTPLKIHKVNVPMDLYQLSDDVILETDEHMLIEEERCVSSFDESWELAEKRNRAGNAWVYALCPDGTDRPWGVLHLLDKSCRKVSTLSKKELPKHKGINEIVVHSKRAMMGWPVTEVDFRPWKVSEFYFTDLEEFWQYVEVIRFGQLQGGSVTENILYAISRECESLRHLHIPKCPQFNASTISPILRNPGFKNLLSLDVSFCDYVDDVVVSAVARMCNHLRSLDLRGCVLLRGTSFADIASCCPHLSTLDISWCPHLSYRDLVKLLASCPLQRLACRGMGRGLYSNADAAEYFLSIKSEVENSTYLDYENSKQQASQMPLGPNISMESSAGQTERSGKTKISGKTSRTRVTAGISEESSSNLRRKRLKAYRKAFVEWCGIVRHAKSRSEVAEDTQVARDSVSDMRQAFQRGEFPQEAYNLERKGYFVRVSLPVGEGLGDGEWLKQSLMGANIQLQLSLRRLDLEGCIGVSDVALISLIYNCKQLEHLRCGHCPKLTAASTTALAVFGKQLKTLNMSYCYNISSPIVDEDITYELAKRARLLPGQSNVPAKQYDHSFVVGLSDLIQKGLQLRNRKGIPMSESLPADNDGYEKPENYSSKSKGVKKNRLEGFYPRWTMLESVNFSGCPGIQEHDLTNLLRSCGELKDISIEGLHQMSARPLQNLHENNFNLVSVCFRSIPGIDNASITTLAEQCPDLYRIDLSGCTGVSNPAIVAIASNCLKLREAQFNFCSQEIHEGSLLYLCRQCRLIEVLECAKKVSEDHVSSLSELAALADSDDPTAYPSFDFKGGMFLFLLSVGLYCPYLRELDVSGRKLAFHEYNSVEDGLYLLNSSHVKNHDLDKHGYAISGEFIGLRLRGNSETLQTASGSYEEIEEKISSLRNRNSLESLFHIRQDEKGPKPNEAIFQSLSRLFFRKGGILNRKQFRVLVAEAPNLLFLDVTECNGATVQDVSTIASSRPFTEFVLEADVPEMREMPAENCSDLFDSSIEGEDVPVENAEASMSKEADKRKPSGRTGRSSMKGKNSMGPTSSRKDLNVTLTSRSKRTETSTQGTSRRIEGSKSNIEQIPVSALPDNPTETPFSDVQPPGFPGELRGPESNFEISRALVDPEGKKTAKSGRRMTPKASFIWPKRSTMVGMYPAVGAQYYIRTDAILMRLGVERKSAISIQQAFRHFTGTQLQLRYYIDRRIRIRRWLRNNTASRIISKAIRTVAKVNSEYKIKAAKTLQFWCVRCLVQLRCRKRELRNKGEQQKSGTQHLAVSLLDSTVRKIWKRLALEWWRMQVLVGRWENQRQNSMLRRLVPKYHADGRRRVQLAFPVDGPEVLGENVTKAVNFFARTDIVKERSLNPQAVKTELLEDFEENNKSIGSIIPSVPDRKLMSRITMNGELFLRSHEVDNMGHSGGCKRVDISPNEIARHVSELMSICQQPRAVRGSDLRPFLKPNRVSYADICWESLERSSVEKRTQVASSGFRKLKAGLEKKLGIKIDSATRQIKEKRKLAEEEKARKQSERHRLTMISRGSADPAETESSTGLLYGTPGAWPSNKHLPGSNAVLNPCIRRIAVPNSSQLVPFYSYPYNIKSGVVRTVTTRVKVPGKSQLPSYVDRQEFLPNTLKNENPKVHGHREEALPQFMGKALTCLENMHSLLGPRILTNASVRMLGPEIELFIINRKQRQVKRQQLYNSLEVQQWERQIKILQHHVKLVLFKRMVDKEKRRLKLIEQETDLEKWGRRHFFEWLDLNACSRTQLWATVLIQTVFRMHSARLYAIKLQIGATVKSATEYLRGSAEASALNTEETLSSSNYGMNKAIELLETSLKLFPWLRSISKVAKQMESLDGIQSSIQATIEAIKSSQANGNTSTVFTSVTALEQLFSYHHNVASSLYGLDRGYDLIGMMRASRKAKDLGLLSLRSAANRKSSLHSVTTANFAPEHSRNSAEMLRMYGLPNPGSYSLAAKKPNRRDSAVMRRASLTGHVQDVRLLQEWEDSNLTENMLAKEIRRQCIRYAQGNMSMMELQDFREGFHDRTFLFQLLQRFYLVISTNSSVRRDFNEGLLLLVSNNADRVRSFIQDTASSLHRWKRCHARMNHAFSEFSPLTDIYVRNQRFLLHFRFNILQSKLHFGENQRNFLMDVSRVLSGIADAAGGLREEIKSRQLYQKNSLQEGLHHLGEAKQVLLFIHKRLARLHEFLDKHATLPTNDDTSNNEKVSNALKRRRTARNLKAAIDASDDSDTTALDSNSLPEYEAELKWLKTEEQEIRQCVHRIETFLRFKINRSWRNAKEELKNIKSLHQASQRLIALQHGFNQKNAEATQLSLELECVEFFLKHKEFLDKTDIENNIKNNAASAVKRFSKFRSESISTEKQSGTFYRKYIDPGGYITHLVFSSLTGDHFSEAMLKAALGNIQSNVKLHPRKVKPARQPSPHPPSSEMKVVKVNSSLGITKRTIKVWYPPKPRKFRHATVNGSALSSYFYSIGHDGEEFGNPGFWYWGPDSGEIYGLLGVRINFNDRGEESKVSESVKAEKITGVNKAELARVLLKVNDSAHKRHSGQKERRSSLSKTKNKTREISIPHTALPRLWDFSQLPQDGIMDSPEMVRRVKNSIHTPELYPPPSSQSPSVSLLLLERNVKQKNSMLRYDSLFGWTAHAMGNQKTSNTFLGLEGPVAKALEEPKEEKAQRRKSSVVATGEDLYRMMEELEASPKKNLKDEMTGDSDLFPWWEYPKAWKLCWSFDLETCWGFTFFHHVDSGVSLWNAPTKQQHEKLVREVEARRKKENELALRSKSKGMLLQNQEAMEREDRRTRRWREHEQILSTATTEAHTMCVTSPTALQLLQSLDDGLFKTILFINLAPRELTQDTHSNDAIENRINKLIESVSQEDYSPHQVDLLRDLYIAAVLTDCIVETRTNIKQTSLEHFACSIICCFWRRSNLNSFHELLASMQAEADLQDTPRWWKMMGIRKRPGEYYQGLAGGEKYAGSLDAYLANIKHQLLKVQNKIEETKREKNANEDVLYDQIHRLKRLISLEDPTLPPVVRKKRAQSEQYTSQVAHANFLKIVEQQIHEAQQDLDTKLIDKAQRLFPDEFSENPTIEWARYLMNQRAKARKAEELSETDIDSDEEEFNQWKNQLSSSYNEVGFRGIIGTQGDVLLWAGNGAQFLKDKWMERYRVKPWMNDNYSLRHVLHQEQEDSYLRGADKLLKSIREKRRERKRKIELEAEQKRIERTRGRATELSQLRRTLATNKRRKQEFADSLRQRIIEERNEELAQMTEQTEGPSQVSHASLTAATKFFMQKVKKKAMGDGKTGYAGSAERSTFFKKKMKEQGVLEGLKAVTFTCGCFQAFDFAVEQIQECRRGRDYFVRFPYNVGASRKHPVYLWYQRTTDESQMIGHMLLHSAPVGDPILDDFHFYEYKAAKERHSFGETSLWYIQGTGRPVTAMACTYGGKGDMELIDKGFQKVVGSWGTSPWLNQKAAIWCRYAVQKRSEATDRNKDMVKLLQTKAEVLPLIPEVLLKRIQWYRNKGIHVPEKLIDGYSKAKADLARTGGHQNISDKKITDAVRDVLKLKDSDIDTLRTEYDRIALTNARSEETVDMSTVYRYSGIRRTHLHEVVFLWMDKQFDKDVTFTAFLRTIVTFCCMNEDEILRFLFYIFALNVLSDVKCINNKEFYDEDGTRMKVHFWDGLDAWDGMGDRPSSSLLPVACFEAMIKFMLPVNSELRYIALVAIDDAYLVAKDNVLTFSQFLDLADTYEVLLEDIFEMQTAFRSSIMGIHWWHPRSEVFGKCRSKILPSSKDKPKDDARKSKDSLATVAQKSTRMLERQPTLRDLTWKTND